MPSRADRLHAALATRFPGARIVIADESAQHAGHAGARPEGETHYRIRMVAPGFAGLSRVARSRAVHEAVAAEFESGLHALALALSAPGEPS